MELVDIHTHILPSLDDGPGSLEAALLMLKQARVQGIKVIAATPHLVWKGRDVAVERIEKGVASLNEVAQGMGIIVVMGAEVPVKPGLLEDVRAGRVPTLGGSGRYILLELPFDMLPRCLEDVIFQLSVNGVCPVLAHPERNRQIQEDPSRLHPLTAAGALSQVNAGSLLGRFGRGARTAAGILLKHNLAQMIGSDAHSPDSRPFELREALRVAGDLVGEEASLLMVRDVPSLILQGREVTWPGPLPYRPRLGRAFLSSRRRLF